MTTRRQILMRFGAVAGTAAAYAAMRALGLAEDGAAWAGMPDLQPGSGAGVKVVILGAGVAGMSAAYELGKAGYECTILEARDRTGGRNWTLRRGTVVEQSDGLKQVCDFDEGEYFNAGPARIPSHHDATLGYCKLLGVQMETEVNYSGSALIQTDRVNGGKPIQMRQAIFDYRGHLAEIFAKATSKGALDQTFSAADRDKLLAGMKNWGGLAESLAYDGREEAGYLTAPGVAAALGTHKKPLPYDVVSDPFVQGVAGFADIIDMQATMQQPVGGMDHIPAAFEAKLGSVIKKGCEVKRIRRSGKGVEIFYVEKASGTPMSIKADYCICTIALPVLDGIPNDFSPKIKAAIKRNVDYGHGYKIAFQSPRFWEANDQIYGGLSFTERDTFITWYPSYGFHKDQGVIVAGYAFGPGMGARSLPDQIAYARETIERLHPGQSQKMKAPISVNWKKQIYNQGLAALIDEKDREGQATLNEGDGPFYFAGDHLSHVVAWQQGAFASSHYVIDKIAKKQASLKP